ncbi:class I SAM-dependent methyltransferase [Pseudonocardiaceae bacterium YIM PH 21723]|nr:class I SAM-dependent methyltransferase [Pseudonocardiaceae bacterium YIM PH 21723]
MVLSIGLPPLYKDLRFHGPLSQPRADGLIRSLAPFRDGKVVDLGCGWGEFLLQVLAGKPKAIGLGLDIDAESIEHGLKNVKARELEKRVELVVHDAKSWLAETGETVDLVIMLGSTHLFAGDRTVEALRAIRPILNPGAKVLLGETFWTVPPDQRELQTMGATKDRHRSLADLVETCFDEGYRLLNLSQASRDEWDAFESQHAAGVQRWLLQNKDSEHFAEVQDRAARRRFTWLSAWRETLGMAYLTLAVD